MGSVEFKKQGEQCKPSSYTISIYNVTKKEDVPGLTIDESAAASGVVTFKTTIKLDSDTEFELRAKGEKDCGEAKVAFKVRVLKPGEDARHILVFTDKKGYPSAVNDGWKRPLYFGPGIAVDKVGNPNEFTVNVDHNQLHAQMGPRDAYLVNPQETIDPNGDWAVKIASESDFKKYFDLGQPQIEVDIDVRCACK